jgi:LysM repeat protein
MKIRLPHPKRKAPSRTPLPARPPRIKLRAAIARSPSRASADDDYEPEPNMKLSHAFVVVLVLHVIAVAGVFAFNSIKARQSGVWEESAAAAQAPKSAAAVPPADAAPAPAQPRTLTAAPQTPAPAATPAQPAGRTHEIRPGDTLTRIAALHGISVGALQQANAITDPTKIRIGDVLKIPPAGAAEPAAVAKATAPAAPVKPAAAKAEAAASAAKDTGKIYEVVKGDNPVSIAKRLKVSYDELMALNAITDPRKLQIGQKLKIPASH